MTEAGLALDVRRLVASSIARAPAKPMKVSLSLGVVLGLDSATLSWASQHALQSLVLSSPKTA